MERGTPETKVFDQGMAIVREILNAPDDDRAYRFFLEVVQAFVQRGG